MCNKCFTQLISDNITWLRFHLSRICKHNSACLYSRFHRTGQHNVHSNSSAGQGEDKSTKQKEQYKQKSASFFCCFHFRPSFCNLVGGDLPRRSSVIGMFSLSIQQKGTTSHCINYYSVKKIWDK